jgi:hypothetical protein
VRRGAYPQDQGEFRTLGRAASPQAVGVAQDVVGQALGGALLGQSPSADPGLTWRWKRRATAQAFSQGPESVGVARASAFALDKRRGGI